MPKIIYLLLQNSKDKLAYGPVRVALVYGQFYLKSFNSNIRSKNPRLTWGLKIAQFLSLGWTEAYMKLEKIENLECFMLESPEIFLIGKYRSKLESL